MPYFTDEQLARANGIDIAQMLMSQGEGLKKQGRVYRWMRYDSTVIHGSKWYRFSRQQGGGPIQFMEHFYGMDFRTAVQHLLNGETGAVFVQANQERYIKPEFEMPELSNNMHRTFAYLIKERKIDPDIVQFFVDERKIFETEEYHNVAFAGYDETGKIQQMHLRSTLSNSKFFLDVPGSDKQYYFRHIGMSETVFVFEAPIDMLSFICMNKEDWQQHSYVCLGGVAIDALKNVLKNNEHITQIYMCLDNDKAGIQTIERIGAELDQMGYEWEPILPENKDWNEDQKQLCQQEQTENFELMM